VEIQVRPGTAADLPEIARVDGISFGFSYTEQHLADLAEREINFTVATAAGRIVGVSGDFRFDLTVPGGAKLNVPGITWVSVLPTHRRRGVLTAMMTALLDGYAAAGDPGAVLTASESSIYRRFGFGVATRTVKVCLDRRLTGPVRPVDTSAVEFLSGEQARDRLPALHEQWEQDMPGALSRDDKWWTLLLRDRPEDRDGMTERHYLVHPGGYVAYRARESWQDALPMSTCVITDYKIFTAEAHAAIWQVLLGLDLFASIESWQLPLDDPLPLLLHDSRRLQIRGSKDGMWLRPIDVVGLLAQRRYPVEIAVVLDVAGERVALRGGPDGAECLPTDEPAQVWLDRPGLGAIYLGGHRPSTLARAGQLRCDDTARLSRLDLAFDAGRAPAFGTDF